MVALIEPEKLADVQTIADKLAKLNEEARLYVAGAVDMAALMSISRKSA